MATKAAARKPRAFTERQRAAVQIAAGIFAGPAGERILEADNGNANKAIAKLAFDQVDAILACQVGAS